MALKTNAHGVGNSADLQSPGFSYPLSMVVLGVLMIGASFLPLGNWAAKSQWTPEDSAAMDKVGVEYKKTAYQSAEELGLSESEFAVQKERMKLRLEAYSKKLERAKSQPSRWSHYLLGIGTLLSAAGFFAHSARQQ